MEIDIKALFPAFLYQSGQRIIDIKTRFSLVLYQSETNPFTFALFGLLLLTANTPILKRRLLDNDKDV